MTWPIALVLSVLIICVSSLLGLWMWLQSTYEDESGEP